MIEYYVFQGLSLISFTFFLSEILYRMKIKMIFTFQKNLKDAKVNLLKMSKNIGRKGNSAFVINLGNKMFNFHHSRLGWILAGMSVLLTNINLLWLSIGLISHHIIREKKFF